MKILSIVNDLKKLSPTALADTVKWAKRARNMGYAVGTITAANSLLFGALSLNAKNNKAKESSLFASGLFAVASVLSIATAGGTAKIYKAAKQLGTFA